MHWESLNEYIERAYKAGYEDAHKDLFGVVKNPSLMDGKITDKYVDYVEKTFPQSDKWTYA